MYEALLNTVDIAVNSFVINVFTGVSNDITSTLRLMMILSIVLYGVSIVNGWIEFNFKDATKHVFVALVVYIFATNIGIFTSFTYEIFTNSPNMLLGRILIHSGASSEGGTNQFIENAYNAGMRSAGVLMFETGWSVGLKLVGLLVGVITVAVCGYTAFLVILSKIAVAVLLSLSPIFIAFLMFKSTRGLFEGWLRQLINFAIIPLLTYTIMIFCLAMMYDPIVAIEASTNNDKLAFIGVMPYIFTGIVSILLLRQVMGIASGIAGGVSLSMLNVIGNTFGRNGALSMNKLKSIDMKLPKFISNSIKN
ncbi:MAG: type IV secretion system protein [Sedimenticola sp.]